MQEGLEGSCEVDNTAATIVHICYNIYFILTSYLKKYACGFRRCWQVFNSLLHSSGRVLVENLQKFWVPKGGNRFHFNSFLRSGKVRVLDAHSCSFVGIFNCLLFCFGFRGLSVGWCERVVNVVQMIQQLQSLDLGSHPRY